MMGNIIFKDIDDTATTLSFSLQDIHNIIWVNVASHTRLNFPSGDRKICQAKFTPPGRNGAPHERIKLFFPLAII